MSASIARSLVILAVMLALTVIAGACYLPPPRPLPESPTATAAPAPTIMATQAPVAALTPAQLANTAYSSEAAPARKVTLVNGKFEASAGAGAMQKLTATLTEPIAIGDLNGDGAADAAVVLATNTGGTGIFKSLHAVLNQAGQPAEAAAIPLGDRVQIKSLTIQSGAILVDMLTHGPKDPLCCPTVEVVQTYTLQGNALVLLSAVQRPTIRLAK